MAEVPDISIIYYTANVIDESFQGNVIAQLLDAAANAQIISVSKKPMDLGHNIVTDLPRSHVNIYRQALIGAKAATTKYIAMAEDDVLYSPEHFKRRPSSGKFGYNLACWGIFTWGEPLFTYKGKGRRNLHSLICERDLFIEAMEERFAMYGGEAVDIRIWAEPGKYERHLGVTVRETEEWFTNPPNVVFSHQTGLAFKWLGTKKRLGEMRANTIPYWGEASEIIKMYKNAKIRPQHPDTSQK